MGQKSKQTKVAKRSKKLDKLRNDCVKDKILAYKNNIAPGHMFWGDKCFSVGLNTCMFIVILTSEHVFGWHASSDNMKGCPLYSKINEIINYLTYIKENNLFIKGYIFSGNDRNSDLSLSEDSTTVKLKPHISRTNSRDFILNILEDFDITDIHKIKVEQDTFIFADSEKGIITENNKSVFLEGCEFNASDLDQCKMHMMQSN